LNQNNNLVFFQVIEVQRIVVKETRRHRYISFHVTYKKDAAVGTQSELIQILRERCYVVCSKNTRELGLWVVSFDGTTGILKCYHQEKDNVTKLLQSLDKIEKKPMTITTLRTSGTIQGLAQKKLPRTR